MLGLMDCPYCPDGHTDTVVQKNPFISIYSQFCPDVRTVRSILVGHVQVEQIKTDPSNEPHEKISLGIGLKTVRTVRTNGITILFPLIFVSGGHSGHPPDNTDRMVFMASGVTSPLRQTPGSLPGSCGGYCTPGLSTHCENEHYASNPVGHVPATPGRARF